LTVFVFLGELTLAWFIGIIQPKTFITFKKIYLQ